MSAGFRVFLLILVAFGAIYAYRFRHPEISRWLKAETAPPAADPLDQLISPVDRILERDYSLARLVLTSPSSRTETEAEPQEPGDSGQGVDLAQEMDLDEDMDLTRDIAEDANDLAPLEEPLLAENGDAAAESTPELEDSAPPSLDHRFEEVEYKVEPGDNLWKIAARKLGSGARHTEIRAWNPELFRDQNPDLLVAGSILKLRFSLSGEILKVSPGDADSTVEGNSRPALPRPEALRKSDRPNARSKRITRN